MGKPVPLWIYRARTKPEVGIIELNSATFAAGGLVERLNEKIQKAVANCLDVNTDAKKTRTVMLKIKIKPTETRTFASVTIETSSTLCPSEAISTSIHMTQNLKTGEIAAFEVGVGENPMQETLPGTEHTFQGKITHFTDQRRYRIRELVKEGALIAAEIDRLQGLGESE